ncbi:hypothetical protein BC938DRAFT_477839, partial [Jimgerdemannia flammicorona]
RREFETLATVFGMPELSEPKPLWERTEVPDILQSAIDAARILESQRHGPGFIDAKDKEAARKIPPHSSSPQLFSIPSSTSFTTTGSSQAQPISIIRKQQQQQDARRRSSVVSSNASFILPAIPSVSHFDELDDKISESSSSTRDGFRAQSSIMSLSPSHQQSYNSLLHPDARSIASTSSSDKFAISQAASSAMTLASLAPPTRAPSTVDQRAVTAVTNPEEVPPPLLFYDHPPSIFDLLKADDDDRIIARRCRSRHRRVPRREVLTRRRPSRRQVPSARRRGGRHRSQTRSSAAGRLERIPRTPQTTRRTTRSGASAGSTDRFRCGGVDLDPSLGARIRSRLVG